jgi:DNA-binding LacI/PurR family transcriptional regulator
MSRRTTINDVAKAACVGKVTVSYVLNGRAGEVGISRETSERVMAVARQLDYRPNAVARMLARSRSEAIAVVFQHAHYFSATSGFLSEAMRGVCEECVQLGLDVMLHTKPARDPREEADALSDGRVDGVLMLRDEEDPTLAALVDRGFPVVLFFCRSNDPAMPYIDCDNFAGGKIAANYLISLGHRSIGMVVGAAKSVDSSDRFQGFRSSMEAAGLAVQPANIARIEGPYASAAELVAMLSRPDRPSALFVWSDDVAFECMRTVRELGLRIPEDISLVGFDSTAACDRVDPPLTSIHQPITEMARMAARNLKSLLENGSEPTQQIVFPPHLDERRSAAPRRS